MTADSKAIRSFWRLSNSLLIVFSQIMFSSQSNRRPFEVPDTVRWDVLLDELHWFWIKNCKDTGSGQREARGLDEEARRYLSLKLLGEFLLQCVDDV